MKEAFAATVKFNVLEVYNLNSPIFTIENPQTGFFQEGETNKLFKKLAKKLYIPTLELFLNQEITLNIIVSGNFLEKAAALSPKLINLLKKLISQNLIVLAADGYYGEDYSSVYNSSWWSSSLVRTIDKIKEVLKIDTKFVYLPQLFRNLELERLLEQKKIKHFLLRQKGKKFSKLQSSLSELRRFNGKTVSWINSENDLNCHFNFIPDNLFFNINGNYLQPDLIQASKTFALAVAFNASEYEIKKDTKKLRTATKTLRINEKPVLNLFGHLEKATFRLWEYALRLVLNKYHLEVNEKVSELLDDCCRLQNSDFLMYLDKSNYFLGKNVDNFSSPFEAFVFMQSKVKQVEIIIRNGLV